MRMRLGPRALALSAALALGAGCFFDTGGGYGGYELPPDPPPARGTGRILIAWTIGGKPAAADVCAGVDHLELRLETAYGAVTSIAPIPCDLTRFRFDNLPTGSASLRLTALDKSDCELARTRTRVVIAEELPAAPDPVLALPAPVACP